MSKNVIHPSLVTEYGMFGSTKIRFNALLSPIQSRSYKHSDFLIYAGRPIMDLIAAPSFLLDAVISAFNCVTSLIAVGQLWSSSVSPRGFPSEDPLSRARTRWEHTKEHFCNCVSALFAAIINPLLSIGGLFTRPLSSLVHAVADLCADSGNYRFR
ncbi:MAG: hypothetical protein P4L79_02795 [Legionella sp.]|uniref:hypothetical protein n=1 Tax=Legionella sp. TaxID=459 RepID=UPI00284C93E7|nr:hypothetical protein [Legionella sp.]